MLIIQAAIHTRDPELIAAILEEEARYEVEDDDGEAWSTRTGTSRAGPRQELAALSWPERVAKGVRIGGADGVTAARPPRSS